MDASPRLPTRITPPTTPLPAGATDCHAHVFGPFARFPLDPARTRTPPEAPPEAHEEMQRILGFSRSVIVQGSAHGVDNRAVAAAVASRGEAARGIGVIDENADDAMLANLVGGGFRGMRFTEITWPGGDRKPVSGFATLREVGARLARHGLHAQLFTEIATFIPESEALLGLGVPVVVDHMGKAFATPIDLNAPDTARFIELVRDGRIWVKMTVIRGSDQYPTYGDLRPFHDALVAANPRQLVWGSDWPLLSLGDKTPDPGGLIDIFDDWTGHDRELRRAVFIDNPARLYGFEQEVQAADVYRGEGAT